MSDLRERLERVRARVAAAALEAGRDPSDVRVIAISKTFPAVRLREALDAGQRELGENRVQEAEAKLEELGPDDRARGVWHLVGRLQRNKARKAVELFDVIHSVDRPELARALDRAARDLGRRPRVLLQVDLDDEPQKGGVAPDEAPALLARVEELAHLDPVGWMAIPRPRDDAEQMRPAFARLRELRDQINADRPAERRLRELSMGMSADFEVAVAEGATWVRVGTAIFGERKPR